MIKILMAHFTVVRLVAKPLNRIEARVDFVVIQTLLLFIYTLLHEIFATRLFRDFEVRIVRDT